MTSSRRWVVTYTKHLKQKRKIYHDGIIELNDSGSKILLYDDSEKLIDSRFLKKDDVIKSGGTLTFEAHLVDVGNLEGKNGPLADSKLNEKAQALQQKEDNKSTILSDLPHKVPSRTNFRSREFLSVEKKINTFRSRSLQGRSSVKRPTTNDTKVSKNGNDSLIALQAHVDTKNDFKEWNILYTTQVTQKAKKYHDGILRLLSCGSHMNQIMLLSEDGSVLSSKYLKTVECVKTGNKCELPNHLVEICELRSHPAEDCQELPSEPIVRSNASSTKLTENICKVQLEQVVSSCSSNSVKYTDCSRVQNNNQLRDVCQILRTLKKPLHEDENNVTMCPLAQANASTSSVDTTNQSKDLNLQEGGNCKGDSGRCVTQASSATPDIELTSIQKAMVQPKLEIYSLATETSVEGYSISESNPGSLSINIQEVSADKHCCCLTSFTNENAPVGEPGQSNGKEDTVDASDKFLKENDCSDSAVSRPGTWNANDVRGQTTDMILKEGTEQERRCGMVEILGAPSDTNIVREKFESRNLLDENLTVDFPSFDLGF
ncbi:hypothetical protein Cni_G10181 [Canna indica]|uniref:5'-3' DNA helicase ZGRF1-like N-terminal domain-containing protein n=1 Tax=Canna indica TaxID=4628 RepID=A0AAQ3K3X2_9LILI|nr:hypothetical protein Cni_G10181 [Canna indica]